MKTKPRTTAQKLIAAAGALALATASVQAQSADAIIDKLVQKGILTVEEANELKEESDKGFGSAFEVKTGLPDWVTSLRIGGDFRARYEMFHAEEETFTERHRFRYRVRPGIFATIRDNFELGLRLTSSERADDFGGDPISGNTTFTDNASKKFIYIDLAYGRWTAIDTGSWKAVFTAGKMESPFVLPDLVWDGDYTPEGFAQQFTYEVNDQHSVQFNLGQFVVEEIGGSSHDSYMFGGQLRLDSKWGKHWASSLGLTGLALTNEERLSETGGALQVPNSNRGNSRTDGILDNNYNPYILDGSIGYTFESAPFYNAAFPVRLLGEYVNNPAADEENEAYAFGVAFGKAGKKGLWELSYRWKHLEGDAWYEEIVESDFGGLAPGGAFRAGTNVEGHVIKMAYSPYDFLTLGLSYYHTRLIEFSAARGAGAEPDGFKEYVGRLQLDAVLKF